MKNPAQGPETVRSGRHANFFIIENSIVDNWAGVLGPISIAVYCCLWRHADGDDSTFIGTSKLAEKLKLSPRAMQRALKTLADHKLIRIARTAKPVRRTVFHMLPVPSPAKGPAPMPLFDSVRDQSSSPGAQSGAKRRRKAGDCTGARVGGLATAQSPGGDCTVVSLLMEQDPFNKRGEKPEPPGSSDLALKMIQVLALPNTVGKLKIIEAAIVAEAAFRECSPEDAAQAITQHAMEDRRRGVAIDRWYFEETKWRRIECDKSNPVAPPAASEEIKRELAERRENWNKRAEAPVQ
jgi:hypothetical protein